MGVKRLLATVTLIEHVIEWIYDRTHAILLSLEETLLLGKVRSRKWYLSRVLR